MDVAVCSRRWRRALAGLAAFMLTAGFASGAVGSVTAEIPEHTFVDVRPAVTASLDPAGASASTAISQVEAFTSPLIRTRGVAIGSTPLAGPYAASPYLATSWKPSPRGSYTFILRKDAKSAAGNPLTAEDVKYSLERALALSPLARSQMGLAQIDPRNPVTVIGEREARVNTTGPGPFVLAALESVSAAILDSKEMRAHASERDPWSTAWAATHSAGFGAYDVDGFQPGSTLALVANPGYFGSKPYFRTVIVKAIADAWLRAQLVATGNASHTSGLEWSQFESLTRVHGVTVRAIQSMGTEAIAMDRGFTPWLSKDVRQALSYAIDRDAIAREIFGGYAQPAYTVIPTAVAFRTPPPRYGYDPARAKQLLSRAGYPNGFEVTVTSTPNLSGTYAAGELALIQAQLGKVGIKASVNVIPLQTDYAAQRAARRLTTTLGRQSMPIADAGYAMYQSWLTAGSACQLNGPTVVPGALCGSPALDKLLFGIRQTAPGPRLDRYLEAAMRAGYDDVQSIPLVQVPTQSIAEATVKGFRAYPSQGLRYDALYR